MDTPIKGRAQLAAYFDSLGFRYGAEVGVFKGNFSKLLCQTIPNLKLLCVDNWVHRRSFAYKVAKQAVEGFDVTLIRQPSMEAVKDVADNSLDFVYIDADHSYKCVLEDVTEWTKKVKPGGIVSGDDYYKFAFSGNTGVIDAVNEYVAKNNIELLVTKADIENPVSDEKQPQWYFFKK